MPEGSGCCEGTKLIFACSGAALATVVGVLIEVPVMLMLVKICLRTRRLFGQWGHDA